MIQKTHLDISVGSRSGYIKLKSINLEVVWIGRRAYLRYVTWVQLGRVDNLLRLHLVINRLGQLFLNNTIFHRFDLIAREIFLDEREPHVFYFQVTVDLF